MKVRLVGLGVTSVPACPATVTVTFAVGWLSVPPGSECSGPCPQAGPRPGDRTGDSGYLQLSLLSRRRDHGDPSSRTVPKGEPQVGEMAGGEHPGRLYGLSFCPIDSQKDPDHQCAGTGERGDSSPHPSGRIFPNEDSVLRLTSAVLAEIHEEWLTGR